MEISIEDVVVGERKRELREDTIPALMESISTSGLINPITVTKDGVLVAGLHRLESCRRLNWSDIPCVMRDLEALDAELIEIDENLIRNELAVLERGEILKRRKEIYEVKWPETRQGMSGGWHNNKGENLESETISFSRDTAAKTGLTSRTIQQEVQIATNLDEEVKERLKEVGLADHKTALLEISRLSPAEQREIVSYAGRDLTEAEILSKAKAIRQAKRVVNEERRLEIIRRPVIVPEGKYCCLVIDPPWPMQKIERDERPNQVGFDYPTMTEEELQAFPLTQYAADDCHLYLWTTHKFLPMALRLADHWSFNYQCLMTWVKNVGFTPFSWMYSTEHVLFCRKGNLSLLTLGKRLDFSAKVREHSRKPDEFYDLVRIVSPGPRLDIFSREKHEGFEQFGNEVEKFAWDQTG